jgi:hypothetical protein
MKKERVRNSKKRTAAPKKASISLSKSRKSSDSRLTSKKTAAVKSAGKAKPSARIRKVGALLAAGPRTPLKPRMLRQEIKGKTFFVPPAPASNGHSHTEDYGGAALPFSYNETKLILLPRDPEWAFGYWDFSGTTWNWIVALGKADSNIRPVLRVYNIDRGGHYDLSVNLEAKNWYLHFSQPGCSFEAELGLIDSKGIFNIIARSNRIRMPRNGPSDIIGKDWEPDDFQEIYRLSGGGTAAGSSNISSQFLRKKKRKSS